MAAYSALPGPTGTCEEVGGAGAGGVRTVLPPFCTMAAHEKPPAAGFGRSSATLTDGVSAVLASDAASADLSIARDDGCGMPPPTSAPLADLSTFPAAMVVNAATAAAVAAAGFRAGIGIPIPLAAGQGMLLAIACPPLGRGMPVTDLRNGDAARGG
mmetsp:Transcript_39562/g.97914  ORF Transcript_39562/g.97914 Transcript_39562/m.97914 type:complete len:157 (-) Transcript_39562:65-535(-)